MSPRALLPSMAFVLSFAATVLFNSAIVRTDAFAEALELSATSLPKVTNPDQCAPNWKTQLAACKNLIGQCWTKYAIGMEFVGAGCSAKSGDGGYAFQKNFKM